MFRGSEQVRAGRLTKAQLRSTAWRRLFPDVYACASLPIDHARRTRAAARLALPGAVVSGRSAGVLRGVDLDQLRASAAALGGPGCRQIRRAAALADGLAESPQETRVRLLLHRSRLPRPTAQYTVRGPRGQFVARVDFAWPDAKVAVEYEGVWHGQSQQVTRDRRRLNDLSAAGWTVVFVTAADLRDPVQLVARIAAALTTPRYV
jgi:very-short-patch-repair endonuclease